MKVKHLVTLLFLSTLTIIGCKKRDGGIQSATIQLTAEYPSNYSTLRASNVQISLVSKTDGTTYNGTTDANGTLKIADIIPGTYNISAVRAITATEAQTLTGIAQQIQLNAAQNDFTINGTSSLTLKLSGSAAGSLLIKEVYYTGSKTPTGGTYFSDQFVEIYNNSTEVIYLDGLCIADLYGNSGLINPNSPITPYKDDTENSYASNVWRIPGSGKQHPLAPGSSIVIAQDGVNHKEATLNPNSPVDLSNAEWETYNQRDDNRDADAPNVPNLEKLYFTGGFDWLLTVFGPGLVIFRTDDFNKLEKVAIPNSTLPERIKIPNNLVIDAFEALKDASSVGYKRVPVALDAGFVYAADTYNAESFRRKVVTTINGRRILQDTNNSGNDFVKLARPTPKTFN
jgi:hypothetical protein